MRTTLTLAAAVAAVAFFTIALPSGAQAQAKSTPVVQIPVASGDVPGLVQNPLTLQQRQQIISIRTQANKQIVAVSADTSLTQQQRIVRMGAIMRASHLNVLKVLTPAQRTEFMAAAQSAMGAEAGVSTGAKAGAGPSAAVCPSLPGLVQNPLSASQQQQIADIQRQTQQQVEAIQGNACISADQRSAMIAQVSRSERDQIAGVLTPEQQAELKSYWQMGSAAAGSGAGPGSMCVMPGLSQYPLSSDQQQCIAQAMQQTAQQVTNVQCNTALTDQQRCAQIAQIRLNERNQVMSVLTPQQRQEFMGYWGISAGAPGYGAGPGMAPTAAPDAAIPEGPGSPPAAESGAGPATETDQSPVLDLGPGNM